MVHLYFIRQLKMTKTVRCCTNTLYIGFMGSHLLELLPLLRRIPCSCKSKLLYSIIFVNCLNRSNCAIAVDIILKLCVVLCKYLL